MTKEPFEQVGTAFGALQHYYGNHAGMARLMHKDTEIEVNPTKIEEQKRISSMDYERRLRKTTRSTRELTLTI